MFRVFSGVVFILFGLLLLVVLLRMLYIDYPHDHILKHVLIIVVLIFGGIRSLRI